MASSAEREIRDAVAAHLRAHLTTARIIHELVVGECRADLAAVEPERITVVEIKSAKDTLKRLDRQVRTFQETVHRTIVVAHERWFEEFDYTNGRKGFRATEQLRDGHGQAQLWCYPEGREGAGFYNWRFDHWKDDCPEPHAAKLLNLMWRDECAAECFRHQISASSRTPQYRMVRDMAWHMSGKEIARAVCRQLRQRSFPEADAPVYEQRAAA